MPKTIDYPRASFKNSLELAKAVSDLGGSCNKETCAEHMKRKLSGGFTALIAATVKYGLVKNASGNLQVTQLYKDYEHSYDEDEKITHLNRAFFNVPVFKKVYETYKDKKLPSKIFDKVLIREFNVEENMASKVKGYFIEAAKMVNLLNSDDTFNSLNKGNMGSPEEDEGLKDNGSDSQGQANPMNPNPLPNSNPNKSNYVISIVGPAINQTIEVIEEDHLDLVEAVLTLVRKKLKAKDEDN